MELWVDILKILVGIEIPKFDLPKRISELKCILFSRDGIRRVCVIGNKLQQWSWFNSGLVESQIRVNAIPACCATNGTYKGFAVVYNKFFL
jgi:hypothetical protein